jgi:hypothetical protein
MLFVPLVKGLLNFPPRRTVYESSRLAQAGGTARRIGVGYGLLGEALTPE